MTRRRGFATFTAVAMLALVGVGLATLGGVFAWQAKRTQQAHADAQLRQLLHAGGAYAAEVMAGRPGATEASFPEPEGAGEVRVSIDPLPRFGAATARVEARLGDAVAVQRLRFEPVEGAGWRLTGAELERPR